MTIEALLGVDFSAGKEPRPSDDFRVFLEAWLRYQRHEFVRKLRDLTPEQMVSWSVPPVELSVLGTTGVVVKMSVQLWPEKKYRSRLFLLAYDSDHAFGLIKDLIREEFADDLGVQ